MGILKPFKRLFSKSKPPPVDAEALKIDFKDRYHHFKLLLTANQRCLEIMAELEAALYRTAPFGMTFIRSHCTAASVNVFRMIQNLDALSRGKYAALAGRFEAIQKHIDAELQQKKKPADRQLVVSLKKVDRHWIDQTGGKMSSLGEVKNTVGLRVPEGFVITAAAYERFMLENDLQPEIDRLFQSAAVDDLKKLHALSACVQQAIVHATVPAVVVEAIQEGLHDLSAEPGSRAALALRSSALGEDSAQSAFAGQYHSALNVNPENVLTVYKEVLAGKYSPQAISYRLNRGFRDEDIAMCVGVTVMVDADAGGVVYSRNPLDSGDNRIFINSAWGLPKSVVDGGIACDLFVVSRTSPMHISHQEIQDKARQFVCLPDEGLCRMELTGSRRRSPSLTAARVLELARTAVMLEAHYAAPQDIEWAVSRDGSLFVLQSRPMQSISADSGPMQNVSLPDTPEAFILRGGVTASPGAASGPVFRIEKEADMLAFPEGAVMVSRDARPRWAALLNRAAAVVTEQGGFAGHLANVAREFGVPAIFGLQDAANRLDSGQVVTVDADRRRIFNGRLDALLRQAAPVRNPMAGSPVYKVLESVSRWIVPLHLLEPDAPNFKAGNCRTFHDITRFIHEKAVQEMFAFGKDHHFAERAGKQLFYKVPMQWWVLDLDDGFVEPVHGKFVRLENIRSRPMLAFWEGFTTVPWDGPPAVDGRGLLSVMFQSTLHQGLTPGLRSTFADRNYFMIARNYCNLSSRLGYHFSNMEAYVGDRPTENYVSFQFKGGAADYQRRLKRILFIADILTRRAFSIERHEDMLLARYESGEAAAMEVKLKILGYLTLHTRQLDMIMDNGAATSRCRQKIEEDFLAMGW